MKPLRARALLLRRVDATRGAWRCVAMSLGLGVAWMLGSMACGEATPLASAPTTAVDEGPRVITIPPPTAPASASTAPTASNTPDDAVASVTMLSALPTSWASATPVAGGTVGTANVVVASFASDFRRCYNDALTRDRSATGTLRITAKVGADGDVTSATATRTGRLDRAIEDCCVGVVKRGKFAPPESGGMTLTLPVTFATPP